MSSTRLDQDIATVHSFGKKLERPLGRLGIVTVRDLLMYTPVGYDDLRQVVSIDAIRSGQRVVVRGRVESIANRKTFRRRMMITEAIIADTTGSVRCVWFQQPYIAHAFRDGAVVLLVGDVAQDQYGLHLVSPIIERDTDENIHAGRIVPVYRLTYGISQKQLRFLVHAVLPAVRTLEERLSPSVRARARVCGIRVAMRAIHFPKHDAERIAAERRLACDELVDHFLRVHASRAELATAPVASIRANARTRDDFIAQLPFLPTEAQRRVIDEVLGDLGLNSHPDRPMQRLVNGDVGSGKTVIAGCAAACMALAGGQVAYLVPTEVLAAQQEKTLSRWLAPLGVRCALWTRTLQRFDGHDVCARDVATAVKSGDAQVVVGTHALVGKAAQFSKLALAIVDEQHRFGVAQRAALRGKGSEVLPHLLSMTATPIPRTLALALLGDLQVSNLDERPAARSPVHTEVITSEQRLRMTRAVKNEVASGRQVFIVCPKIDVEESGETAAVIEAFERAQRAFPGFRIGLLHGRLPAKEQRALIEAFGDRQLDILVSTTVIEVGVDQPNATIMIIEDAERFGLAQLHQLRGRVGRGDWPGTCYLTTKSGAPTARQRLTRVASCTDGFALAEIDLKERGPGAVFGTVQSGWPEFRYAKFDTELMATARDLVESGAVQSQVEAAHLE
ncbi:MAG: ATP-dependent DNA helicase RecG [Candidatus Uhrbacteria bacterium]